MTSDNEQDVSDTAYNEFGRKMSLVAQDFPWGLLSGEHWTP